MGKKRLTYYGMQTFPTVELVTEIGNLPLTKEQYITMCGKLQMSVEEEVLNRIGQGEN